jgi:heptosyltransferase II
MPNWIGDFVMGLSVVLRTQRAAGSGATTLLVPDALVGLAELLCDLPVVPIKRENSSEWLRSVRSIRAVRAQTLYLLPHSFSSGLLAWASGITRRRGIVRDGRRMLLSDRLPRSLRDHRHHLTREYAAVLETEWVAPEQCEAVRVPVDEKRRGCVVLCPGAQYGPAKQWPWFAELTGFLGEDRIVVLGGPGDHEAGERVARRDPQRVENICGKTSLVEAAGILAGAACVVSNDSGLMHLAGLLGTPVVGIFGSTDPVWTRPLGTHARVVHRAQPCSPCLKRTCRFGHYDCLRRIPPDEVAAAVTDLRAAYQKQRAH